MKCYLKGVHTGMPLHPCCVVEVQWIPRLGSMSISFKTWFNGVQLCSRWGVWGLEIGFVSFSLCQLRGIHAPRFRPTFRFWATCHSYVVRPVCYTCARLHVGHAFSSFFKEMSLHFVPRALHWPKLALHVFTDSLWLDQNYRNVKVPTSSIVFLVKLSYTPIYTPRAFFYLYLKYILVKYC